MLTTPSPFASQRCYHHRVDWGNLFGSVKFGHWLLVLLLLVAPVSAQPRPNPLLPDYEHDRWVTLPQDQVFKFTAFTLSFDGDDNGLAWGVPEWVAFEIKRLEGADFPVERPGTWMTDNDLFSRGIAPNDATYAISGTNELREVQTDFRYTRGHMCPKDTAERISADAAFNTHTVLNAVPQLQWQNAGIWLDLEDRCENWADEHGRIWVICGPVFFKGNPSVWLGQKGEKQAAVPDALFKIVIREDGDEIRTLSFVIPNIIPKEDTDLTQFLQPIDRIEALTGLDFLSSLPADRQVELEQFQAESLDF